MPKNGAGLALSGMSALLNCDLLSQRWLTRYLVNEDWKGQLEPSLIALKTTQLHQFHEVLRSLNQFLPGKEIESDMVPGDNRLSVRLRGIVASATLWMSSALASIRC